VWVYLKREDLEFIDGVRTLIGAGSRGETIKFLLRLLRLMIPRADLVVRFVSQALSEEERQLLQK
jgi:hypothetical protein